MPVPILIAAAVAALVLLSNRGKPAAPAGAQQRLATGAGGLSKLQQDAAGFGQQDILSTLMAEPSGSFTNPVYLGGPTAGATTTASTSTSPAATTTTSTYPVTSAPEAYANQQPYSPAPPAPSYPVTSAPEAFANQQPYSAPETLTGTTTLPGR